MTKPLPHERPSNGGGYSVVDRLTKMQASAQTFEKLFERVGQMRSAVGATSNADLREELENWICEEHPEDCTEVDMTIPRRKRLTLSDVLRGSTVMVAYEVTGSKPVEREEAERRAQICLLCDFNQNYTKPCTGVCAELQALALRVSGNQGTQYDCHLNVCSICGCFLQAAIWIPLNLQCLAVNDTMKKQFQHVPNCWKQCS